ncbi:MAG: HEAT repeat domain-containing protein [Planctomycetota bacterium]|jgi:HEAT repeat protein|nr:HEAT repeat domain-containing protein [Planctomycetota bacterium]MDP7135359.1 HEAT repeat domain-containing protein [Planctomycetota bacterium]MDP7249064.1 HEAT repeat domain-containing protein [Planctomycetota bacterium]
MKLHSFLISVGLLSFLCALTGCGDARTKKFNHFAERLENGTPKEKAAAARAVASFGDLSRKVMPRLITMIEHEDAEVRAAVIFAVGRIGTPPATILDTLHEVAQSDSSPKVKKEAFLVIKQTGGKERQARACVACLDDAQLQQMVITTLTELGPAAEPAKARLIEGLKDKDLYIRMYSAEALGNIGPVAADAVPAIKKLLKDDSEYVRKAAQESIKKIRQK